VSRPQVPAPGQPAARRSRPISRTLPLKLPSLGILFLWAVVPLVMTLWFSFQRYNLLNPGERGFARLENYRFLLTDPGLVRALINTLLLVGGVLAVTVVGGTLLAVLFDQPFFGRGVARVLVIAPFFVMPTVSALIWKNMLMDPVNGVLAFLMRLVGLGPVEWFARAPLAAIIIIVAWQWLPFALLVLLTALQSLDSESREAARLDGAGPIASFLFITLPHLRRAIGVVIMIETIFLLMVFAEVFVTTAGGPGLATTNLAFLIYRFALLDFDIGVASAGGILAIVLANVVAVFLIRSVARNLEA
jgi:sorbitol/mannitol transport system permease protein